MISPRVFIQTTRTKVYEIDSPAVWKDVSDVLQQIGRDPDLQRPEKDDAVMVEAYDDKIRFVFPVSTLTDG